MYNNLQQADLAYTVAAVQFNPNQGEVDRNIRRLVELLTEAAENGAKLIVFPEMSSSGYVWNDREEIAPYVESIPGPTTAALLEVTSKYGCYAAVGLPEVGQNKEYYNSATLIGPKGIVGTYRKTHLYAADSRWAREGNDGIRVFDTEIGRIALLICMDAMYFEPSRIAALQGADIVAFPTNWVGSGTNEPSKTWCLRAKENGLYWVAANRSDTEREAQFTGGSAIIDQNGVAQQWLVSGEGIVYGEVRPDPAKRRKILEVRKPEAYQELLLHPYLWKEGETRPIHDAVSYELIVMPLQITDQIGYAVEQLRLAMTQAASRLQTSNRLFILPDLGRGRTLDPTESASLAANLEQLCAMYGGYIATGLPTSDGNSNRSQVTLIGPTGIVGVYRQVHSDDFRHDWNSNSFRTFELPFGRVGLLSERDAEFPESYRVLAKQGADIIVISGTGKGNSEVWMERIRAFENDSVLACAMPSGSRNSLLFLHSQVALEGNSDMIVQEFIPAMTATARSRPFMRRLKTHLYDSLIMMGKNALRRQTNCTTR